MGCCRLQVQDVDIHQGAGPATWCLLAADDSLSGVAATYCSQFPPFAFASVRETGAIASSMLHTREDNQCCTPSSSWQLCCVQLKLWKR